MMEGALLTSQEAADLLGVSNATVLRASRVGSLASTGTSAAGEPLFTPDSVEVYRRRRTELFRGAVRHAQAPRQSFAATPDRQPEADVGSTVELSASIGRAPVQEAPAQEAPVYEAPRRAAPVQEVPVPEAPVYVAPPPAAPIREAPVHEAPVLEASVQETPTLEVPGWTGRGWESPGHDAPIPADPIGEAPAWVAPIPADPIGEAPAWEAPVREAPVGEAPAWEAPVHEAPVQQAPSWGASVIETPVPLAPVLEVPIDREPAGGAHTTVAELTREEWLEEWQETMAWLEQVAQALMPSGSVDGDSPAVVGPKSGLAAVAETVAETDPAGAEGTPADVEPPA